MTDSSMYDTLQALFQSNSNGLHYVLGQVSPDNSFLEVGQLGRGEYKAVGRLRLNPGSSVQTFVDAQISEVRDRGYFIDKDASKRELLKDETGFMQGWSRASLGNLVAGITMRHAAKMRVDGKIQR